MKSPLTGRPLRNPGQSLDLYIDSKLDNLLFYIMASAMSAILALLEWWRWYSEVPFNPWLYTVLATVVIIYSVFKIRKDIKKLKLVKQGRDGEKAVGQFLEMTRENGMRLFHDIPGNNFNLDHVIICESGIYLIEKKTYSKPQKGDAILNFNGKTIKLNASYESDKPVIQVRAGANWLSKLLLAETGRNFPVKKIIVFPGWYVKASDESKEQDVQVLNPKNLPKYIKNSRKILHPDDVRMSSKSLSKYIRSYIDPIL